MRDSHRFLITRAMRHTAFPADEIEALDQEIARSFCLFPLPLQLAASGFSRRLRPLWPASSPSGSTIPAPPDPPTGFPPCSAQTSAGPA